MILSHPCIRYAHLAAGPGKRMAGRTLVIGTTLAMPEPGRPCEDERLLDLLEYLELVSHENEGQFDSVEIRGGRMSAEEEVHVPHFIPPGARCVNGVCV